MYRIQKNATLEFKLEHFLNFITQTHCKELKTIYVKLIE